MDLYENEPIYKNIVLLIDDIFNINYEKKELQLRCDNLGKLSNADIIITPNYLLTIEKEIDNRLYKIKNIDKISTPINYLVNLYFLNIDYLKFSKNTCNFRSSKFSYEEGGVLPEYLNYEIIKEILENKEAIVNYLRTYKLKSEIISSDFLELEKDNTFVFLNKRIREKKELGEISIFNKKGKLVDINFYSLKQIYMMNLDPNIDNIIKYAFVDGNTYVLSHKQIIEYFKLRNVCLF